MFRRPPRQAQPNSPCRARCVRPRGGPDVLLLCPRPLLPRPRPPARTCQWLRAERRLWVPRQQAAEARRIGHFLRSHSKGSDKLAIQQAVNMVRCVSLAWPRDSPARPLLWCANCWRRWWWYSSTGAASTAAAATSAAAEWLLERLITMVVLLLLRLLAVVIDAASGAAGPGGCYCP